MTSGVLGGRPRALWLSVVLTVILVGGLSVWRGRGYWLGSPTVALGQAQDVTIFGSATVAAYGAWISGHTRTLAERLLVSPRGRHEIDRAPLLFAATAGAAGYCLLLAWMLCGGSVTDGGWSRALSNRVGLFSTLLMLGGSAVFWAGVGVCAGRWLPRVAALVVAPFLAYTTFLVFAVYLSAGSLTGLSLGGNLVYATVEPTASTWWSKGLLWLCLAALMTAATAGGRRWIVSAAAWATGLCAATVIIGGAPLQVTSSAAPTCHGESPQVCVNAGNKVVLGSYDRQVRTLWSMLPASIRPSTVTDSIAASQLGLDSSTQILVAGPINGNIEPANTINAEEFAAYFGDRAIGRACPATNSTLGESGVLKLWWRMTLGERLDYASYPGAPNFAGASQQIITGARGLVSMTEADRDAWVEAHLLHSCPAPS